MNVVDATRASVPSMPSATPQPAPSSLTVAPTVNQQQVDAVLLDDMTSSKALTAAVSSDGLPQLPPPAAASHTATTSALRSFVALPSPGGTIMALMTEQAGEQRRVNKEMMMEQVQATVADMQAEAKKMVTKAVVSLVMGVVSSAVSIASGAASLGTLGKSMKSGELPKDLRFEGDAPPNTGGSDAANPAKHGNQLKPKTSDVKPQIGDGKGNYVYESAELDISEPPTRAPEEKRTSKKHGPKQHEPKVETQPREPRTPLDTGQLQALSVRISAIEGIFSAGASILKGIGDTTAGIMDSKIQLDDASIETQRAMRESLQASTDALNDLIRKALDTYESIQQNMNQTRTKILS